MSRQNIPMEIKGFNPLNLIKLEAERVKFNDSLLPAVQVESSFNTY